MYTKAKAIAPLSPPTPMINCSSYLIGLFRLKIRFTKNVRKNTPEIWEKSEKSAFGNIFCYIFQFLAKFPNFLLNFSIFFTLTYEATNDDRDKCKSNESSIPDMLLYDACASKEEKDDDFTN